MPLPNLYSKYTDPYKLVEFRMFLLNLCNMGCKGCFYKKDGNTFGSYQPAIDLCEDLQRVGYSLETCYLLPTDIFDNEINKTLFESEKFNELISHFRYVGVGSTLTAGWNKTIFDHIIQVGPSVELQVNLMVNHIFDEDYYHTIKEAISGVLVCYPNTVINLALNVGYTLTEQEIEQVYDLVERLSVDKIIEVNFTFLYNPAISPEKKAKMMLNSFGTLKRFSHAYEKSGDPKYNTRTMLRKPSFTFKDGKIYLSPIMPFDEYVFIDDDKYLVRTPSVEGFLNTQVAVETNNLPILEECNDCSNLQICQGKGFFTFARDMNLPCYLKENF